MSLEIAARGSRRYDAVALGEVMLRLDPGEGRIRTANTFTVWEGGGEYNVIRGLSTVFDLDTSLLSGIVDNDLGDLLLSRVRSAGVGTDHIHHVSFDGIGRRARNALNFTERGFGMRGARGVSDRGHSAASQLAADDFDLTRLFEQEGVRWLHTGGVFAGLSDSAADTACAVMDAAQRSGAVVSIDFNYRPSLWPDAAKARAVYRRLATSSTVVIGGETDFVDRLGVPVPSATDPRERFAELAAAIVEEYPGVEVVATTVRTVHSASRNSWQGLAFSPRDGVVSSAEYDELEIFDRVGGGDGFASGLIGSLLDGHTLGRAVEIGAAHGALVMTTPGDSSAASLAEVLALADGASAATTR
ncbi:sugar kinase [Microbacterium sp. NPDC089696]|uniref:sugar kinase n=1 Tax=Microbacterium sp. NPDC089696 TaxID=3364199 RepID=UPI0037F861D2